MTESPTPGAARAARRRQRRKKWAPVGYALLGVIFVLVPGAWLAQLIGGPRRLVPLWSFALLVYGGPLVAGVIYAVRWVKKRARRDPSPNESE